MTTMQHDAANNGVGPLAASCHFWKREDSAMTTQTQRRPTVLTMLEQQREIVIGRLSAIAAEPSPWYVDGVYVADANTAYVRRARLIAELMRAHDRLDRAIEDEWEIMHGALGDGTCELPLGVVARVMGAMRGAA